MLVDESLPKRIWRQMPGFTALTVPRLAEDAGFEAFLTADQSLRYQQNLSNSKLRIIVFEAPSNGMRAACANQSPISL